MAASSYDEALRRLLVHEGGYSNHPSDPGGPTNWGITIFDARAYWKKDATAADVRAMPVEVAKSIYRSKYWAAMRCDELPAGVDYAVFDYGVNSGIGRAGRVLRRVVGLSDETGAVADEVIAAAKRRSAAAVIDAMCDERLAFLQGLRTWSVFGKGWGRRVREVRAAALAMADKAGRRPSLPQPGPRVGGEPGPDASSGQTRPREPHGAPPATKLGIGAAIAAAIGAVAHWIDSHPVVTVGAVVVAVLLVLYAIRRIK